MIDALEAAPGRANFLARLRAPHATQRPLLVLGHTDVVGAEIGGSVKNVIALANGMAVGLGYGANSQAS